MKFTIVATVLQALAVPMAMASAISLPNTKSEMVTTFHPDGLVPRQGAPCALKAHFDASWTEGALARYAVKATASGVASKAGWPNDTEMLKKWCEALYKKFGELKVTGISNLSCWAHDDHTSIAHVSTTLGDYGHSLYVELHQQAVNLWRDWSQLQCDVDSKF